MANVGMKSTSELIDSLITTSIKCFLKQDFLMNAPETETVQVAKDIQILNKRRNALMQEIDRRLGEGDNTVTGKTY